MKRTWIIGLIVLSFVGYVIYENMSRVEVVMATEEAPKQNFLAPAFSAKGLDELQYDVGPARIQHNKKVLLINFWASWCGPCKDEAPDLNVLYEQYKDIVDIYAINSTKNDKEDKARAFVDKYKLKFPVILDKDNDLTERYKILGFPTSYLVDKNGVIREVIYGGIDLKQLGKSIEKYAEL